MRKEEAPGGIVRVSVGLGELMVYPMISAPLKYAILQS